MQFYRFAFSLEQFLFREESQHLVSQGCELPSIILCQLVREYGNVYHEFPSLEQLVMYQYVPCMDECEYIIEMEQAIPILVEGIKRYHILLPCSYVYAFHVFSCIEGRFPRLDEISIPSHDMNHTMTQHVDEFWSNQSSGLARDHFPSRIVSTPTDDSCAICQESIKEGESVITLPCMHTFHSKQDSCNGIEEWYTKVNCCPLCKSKL